LQSFVNIFDVVVGRSLVRPVDWCVPVLLVNPGIESVTIPAFTELALVEQAVAIQSVTQSASPSTQCELPLHLTRMLDDASALSAQQTSELRAVLSEYAHIFPAPGTPVTGRTDAVEHEIDMGDTRPIRCTPGACLHLKYARKAN